MPELKNCFIIMPLTTPDFMMEKYRDGKDHFKHVLDCLFIPSIKQVGYNPIPPIAKGSDLIHAEIINELEKSEIVLCDMSSLNPNVFFEFGIRTSLNKPVCVVKDELTQKVPFDTSILNYQEYQSSLESWFIETEIKKLCEHITTSVQRSKGENTLWKYFGLKSEVVQYRSQTEASGNLEYLVMQVASMNDKIDILAKRQLRQETELSNDMSPLHNEIISSISEMMPPTAKSTAVITIPSSNAYIVSFTGEITPEERDYMKHNVFRKFGAKLELRKIMESAEKNRENK
jgi:hypothetical protein